MRIGASVGYPFTTEEEWDRMITDLQVEVLSYAVTADTEHRTVERYLRWAESTGSCNCGSWCKE